MLVSQLIQNGYPTVNGITDKVLRILQLMDEYDIFHLPVITDGKFSGMIAKEQLLELSEDETMISALDLIKVSIRPEEHITAALKYIVDCELSMLAVVNEHAELEGVIPAGEILHALSRYLGNDEPGGIIVLEIERRSYSFGEICRLVETNDAVILQLNTMTDPESGMMIVSIKINKIEVSDIVATFQRYEYHVKYYFGMEQYVNELKENYNHLIAYLNI